MSGDEYEYQLLEDLLRGYDPRIRPSINSSQPLNVTFGLALSQIIDVVSTYLLITLTSQQLQQQQQQQQQQLLLLLLLLLLLFIFLDTYN